MNPFVCLGLSLVGRIDFLGIRVGLFWWCKGNTCRNFGALGERECVMPSQQVVRSFCNHRFAYSGGDASPCNGVVNWNWPGVFAALRSTISVKEAGESDETEYPMEEWVVFAEWPELPEETTGDDGPSGKPRRIWLMADAMGIRQKVTVWESHTEVTCIPGAQVVVVGCTVVLCL